MPFQIKNLLCLSECQRIEEYAPKSRMEWNFDALLEETLSVQNSTHRHLKSK